MGYSLEAFYCFRKSLSSLGKSGFDLPAGCTFNVFSGSVSAEHIGQLVDAWPPEWRAGRQVQSIELDICRWFRNGDQCAAIVRQHKVLAFSWSSFAASPFLSAGFARAHPMCEGDVLRRTIAVRPSCRGLGLMLAMGSLEDVYLSSKGYTRAIVFVGVNNFASALNSLRAYDEGRVVYHLSVDIFRKHWDFFPKLDVQRWLPCRPAPRPNGSF